MPNRRKILFDRSASSTSRYYDKGEHVIIDGAVWLVESTHKKGALEEAWIAEVAFPTAEERAEAESWDQRMQTLGLS